MTPQDWIFCALLIVTIVVMIILTVYLVKFLKATTNTMISLKELTDAAKVELQPAMKSVNSILAAINKVSNATNNNLDIARKIITTLLGAGLLTFNKVKDKTGFFSGLISGFNIFKKRR